MTIIGQKRDTTTATRDTPYEMENLILSHYDE